MRENPTRRWRACATGSATLAMVLMVTACGTTPPGLLVFYLTDTKHKMRHVPCY